MSYITDIATFFDKVIDPRLPNSIRSKLKKELLVILKQFPDEMKKANEAYCIDKFSNAEKNIAQAEYFRTMTKMINIEMEKNRINQADINTVFNVEETNKKLLNSAGYKQYIEQSINESFNKGK